MAEKVDNNFYDRFMDLKPQGMPENDWFGLFGWNIEQIRTKRSDWKKIDIPKPGTIIHIQSILHLSATELVILAYGNRIIIPETPEAGGGDALRETRVVTGSEKGGARV